MGIRKKTRIFKLKIVRRVHRLFKEDDEWRLLKENREIGELLKDEAIVRFVKAQRMQSVSYTHLDVYKRQVYDTNRLRNICYQ